MKILAVADYPVLAQGGDGITLDVQPDLILSCGDLKPEYLTALLRHFKAPLYYIKGNHDMRDPGNLPGEALDIHGRLIDFHGHRILGLKGSYWYNGGDNQYTEREMMGIIRSLKPSIRKAGGIDIVISHAAPLGIHDGKDQCHRGFKSFRRLIDGYQPRYFLHGHIHQNFDDPMERITMSGSTKVINCCGYYYIDSENE